MSALELDAQSLPSLAATCIVIGHGQKADIVWTKQEFLSLCDYMLNGNAPNDFMLVYNNLKTNKPVFQKAKNCIAARRASWAWETIDAGEQVRNVTS